LIDLLVLTLKAPSSLVEALATHVKTLESGRKASRY